MNSSSSSKEILFGSILLAAIFAGSLGLTSIGKTFLSKTIKSNKAVTLQENVMREKYEPAKQDIPTNGYNKYLPLVFYSGENLDTSVVISNFSSEEIDATPILFNSNGDYHIYKKIKLMPNVEFKLSLSNLANKPEGLEKGSVMIFSVDKNLPLNILYKIASGNLISDQISFAPRTSTDVKFEVGENTNHISISNVDNKPTEITFYSTNEVGNIIKEFSKLNLDPYQTKIISLSDLFQNLEITNFTAVSPKQSLIATSFYKDPSNGIITNISIK